MSATIEVPKGLDTLDAADNALLDAMRADDAGQGADAAAVGDTPDSDGGVWVEFDAAGTPAVVTADQAERRAAAPRVPDERLQQAADMARLQERVNILTHIAQAATTPPTPAATEVPIPDLNMDPVGHFRAIADKQARELGEVKTILDGFQQRVQHNAQIAELRNWGAAQEQAFEEREPSYRAAMDHLSKSRRAELNAIGVTDQGEQQRILGMDITNIAARARQEGVNFAERLYTLAQSRGFQKGARATAAAVSTNNAAQPSTRARNTATSPTRLSVEKIAAMPDRQFAKVVDSLRDDPAALRRLMGE